MKKLTTITFALLLTAGLAYGQNTTETEQNGDNNDITVQQTGNNETTVYQGTQNYASNPVATSTNNTAAVTQNGAFEAFIIQGDAGSAINSETSIDQAGTDGYADILQGVVSGTATSTKATIVQKQSGNTGQIRQGLLGDTEGGSAALAQNGSNNYGLIYQGVQNQSSSLNNTANITQNGNNNNSTTILQGSKLAPAGPGSGSGIAQGNSANIIQDGSSNGTNGVRIFQGLNGGTAINNTGHIYQTADLNNAKINQGVGDGVSVSGSDATIIQYSNSNNAVTTQVGSNHSSTITQN